MSQDISCEDMSKNLDSEINVDDDAKNYINNSIGNDIWIKAYQTMSELKDVILENLTDAILSAIVTKTIEESTRDLVEEFYKKHLNVVWHLYGGSASTRTVDKFNVIMAYGFIKGASCLMSWAINVGSCIIENLDIDSIETVYTSNQLSGDALKKYIDAHVLMHIYSAMALDLQNYLMFGCKDECDNNSSGYKAHDIFDENGNWRILSTMHDEN